MKQTLAAIFIMFSINAFSCQTMTYDPWVHFVMTEPELIADTGTMLWHNDGGRIYGVHYVKAGELKNNTLYDCYGKKVVERKGDSIIDHRGVTVFKISGSKVYDSRGILVAEVRGSKVYNANGTLYGSMK